jgi:hypothetical protein
MAPRGVVVRNLHISKAPPRTTARTSRAARRSNARPAGSGVRVGCQLLGRFLDGLSLTSSLDGAKGLGALPKVSMRHRAMGHHPIAQAIMWRTVTMMMAEAMAMSASKRTLCLRRSILRMRFIAIASRSGSVVSVALSS